MSSTEPSTPRAAPGWYPDGHGAQRWWDGNQWTAHASHPATPVVVAQQSANGAAIASLVLGLVGFAISLTVVGIVVAIPLAVIGLILGIVGGSRAKAHGGRGIATAGTILCSLPFFIWIIGMIWTATQE